MYLLQIVVTLDAPDDMEVNLLPQSAFPSWALLACFVAPETKAFLLFQLIPYPTYIVEPNE
jgi:hypothetical protein